MRPLLLLTICAALVAACGGDGAVRSTELRPADDRPPAPELVAETLDGEMLALAELTGPVVVNFWASWCGPCVAEAPELRNVALGYADRGVSVVGVNVRDTPVNARRFESDLDIPFPSWLDPSSEIAAAFGGIGPAGLPSTLVLDADHRVAVRLFGAVTYTQLRGYLEPLLEEAGRAEEAAAPADRLAAAKTGTVTP
jgi:thiol-disulfide isomerase/thioredoxin